MITLDTGTEHLLASIVAAAGYYQQRRGSTA
jgi:hypothetical protein